MAKLMPTTMELGPLPVDTINLTLDRELDPGDVILTPIIQAHVQRRHPDEYARCLPYVGSVVTNPLYIGDDFANEGKIELIARIASLGSGLLVAVSVALNIRGRYEVRSFYPVSEKKIENRIGKGYLKRAQKR